MKLYEISDEMLRLADTEDDSIDVEAELSALQMQIEASKRHWAKYHAFKKQYTDYVAMLAKTHLRPITDYSVNIEINWFCPDKRKDPDNIAHAKSTFWTGWCWLVFLKAMFLNTSLFLWIPLAWIERIRELKSISPTV